MQSVESADGRRSTEGMRLLHVSFLFALPLVLLACHEHDYSYLNPDLSAYSLPVTDASMAMEMGELGDGSMVQAGLCPVTFSYHPAAGMNPMAVTVAGEFNNWKNPGVALMTDGAGNYSGSASLAPGFYAYKLVVDGTWILDPGTGLRKYVGGVENSAVQVADCALPLLTLASKTITRAAAGKGDFSGVVAVKNGSGGANLDASTIKATLRRDGVTTSVVTSLDAAGIHLDAPMLADGKYSIFVSASDTAGHAAEPLRLVFWIEAQAFSWQDAVVYMIMTDRFVDGDQTNDAPATANVDPRADWKGGDLQGITTQIAAGYFDQMGVNVLWMSPFNTNSQGSNAASDNIHQVTGYHGYWPVKAREVDPRIGGNLALSALVTEAHKHGIRVLQDTVIQHIHQDHEYNVAHPDWFKQGCLCGTNNCDWTVHRLDCVFATYLPNVDWTNPVTAAQFVDDAVWWIDNFDLDGLRLDAVKQVPDIATLNLADRIRHEFEAAGTRVFLTGETAMGWSDCGACNAFQYQTIANYIGPRDLDGQTDFVLYYAVPMNVFVNDNKGMIHADYWTGQSQTNYPAGAIMTPYIGSQDTPRFVTLASYRGQDANHPGNIPGNQWSNIAVAPPDSEPYQRLQIAQSWLLGLPGAPLIYYGDEYGEWGGADPNNRVMWRGAGTLSSDEKATLKNIRALGQARKELSPLRRGAYLSVYSSEPTQIFARQDQTGAVLVALNRTAATQTITTPVPAALSLPSTLHDHLGGFDVTIMGGTLTMTLGPRASAILSQ